MEQKAGLKKNIIITLIAVCAIAVIAIVGKHFFSAPISEKYNIEGLVQIAYSDIDTVCDTPELAAEGGRVLEAMQESGKLLISFVADSAIQITKEGLGEYDHLVITNPAWINQYDDMNNLVPVGYDSLSNELQRFLADHMKVWSVDETEYPDGMSIYEYTGKGLLAFPVNVGYGASAIQAKNPLVVIIDNPTETMKYAEFLLPMTSSGNVVFTDAALLEEEIKESDIAPYIKKVESVIME